ncbi:alpha/beta hydrolase fold domain-containing protein [Natronorubrum sp. JWXQ-INN-674]|uniref:Alpha/beta hydrolase fold domain-containing protein n=1 Tax=Natronorubrum halalkaliphilum TaxID=2691917 RepID=A0A6B0VK20_9EURY|nr:alpha/beta hydrolase [Natronorubrum halalkaliphilum]MXV61447.1 alpha/beta hydrolase fold domain-containing protein [Natronorubrum halalkaliphilum]
MDSPDEATDELDPQFADVLWNGRAADLPAWHSMSVADARRVEDEVFSAGDGPAVDRVDHRRIDGPGGDLPVRIYWPTPEGTDEELPALVFAHGGGWVLGTLDSADDLCRAFATHIGAAVISVDYRLAPEHPFPAAVEDVRAAFEWAHDNAASLEVDPDRLGVAGSSAGAGLAAAVALETRECDVSPAAQLLCYPILERDFETRSYREHADASLLSRGDMEWFWEQYLAEPSDADDPRAAPLRAETVAGAPPAVIATAGHDVLRSEGVAYADRLQAVGVETRHCHYPSLAHGFLSLTEAVDRAETAMDEVTAAAAETL